MNEVPPKPEFSLPRLGYDTPEEKAEKRWHSFFDGFGGFPERPEAFDLLLIEKERHEAYMAKVEEGGIPWEDAKRKAIGVGVKIDGLVASARKTWAARVDPEAVAKEAEETEKWREVRERAPEEIQAAVDRDLAKWEAEVAAKKERARARQEKAELEAGARESADSQTETEEEDRVKAEAKLDRMAGYMGEEMRRHTGKVVPLRPAGGDPNVAEETPAFPWRERLRWADDLKRDIVPALQFWVAALWPKVWLSLLNGDGGAGKSTLLTQLFSAMAQGRPVLGLATLATKTMLISTEEDDELASRRLNGTPDVGRFPVFNLLDWPGPIEVCGALRDGTVVSGPFMPVLREMIGDLRPELVGLDHAGDLFLVNENSKAEVNAALQLLRPLHAEFGVGFVLTQHISKAGMASGRRDAGTPQWHNKARWRAALYPPGLADEAGEDEVLSALAARSRVLEVMKDNYGGKAGTRMSLLRESWHFVEERGEIGKAVARSLADRLLEFALRVLPTCDGRRLPLALKAPGGMVSQFVSASGLKGSRGEEVHRCLLELIAGGKLGQVSEGPVSKLRSYVVLL